MVSESHVTWATSVPMLVCSQLSSDVRDSQTSDALHRLMLPYPRGGA